MNNVSIIIPVKADSLQQVHYLQKCIASCAGQGIPVVANDGSSASLETVRRGFDGVWLDLEHKGKSAARNAAVEAAPTELIYPLDADDWLARAGDMSYLLAQWRGIPLYTDITKWYNENRKVVHLFPGFHCETILKQCTFTVNVLHTKAQWREAGGWPVGVQLFEDWQYNIKLFWRFCAHHIAIPMVNYRQHVAQSTQVLRDKQSVRIKEIRSWAQEYVKEQDMARSCCGKRRKNTVNTNAIAAAQARGVPSPPTYGSARSLPGESGDGIMPAVYVGGKGQGAHILRGHVTGHPYRVRNGVRIMADRRDTCSREERRRGMTKCKLVRVEAVPQVVPEPKPLPMSVAAPRAQPKPPPIDAEMQEAILVQRTAEISSMLVKDILANVDSWDESDRAVYLEAEKRGKSRITVLKLLEKK